MHRRSDTSSDCSGVIISYTTARLEKGETRLPDYLVARRDSPCIMEQQQQRRSAAEIIEQYLPLVRKYERDDNLVLSGAEEEAGTKAGENFMSIVLRTTVTGKRGNGAPYKKSFMRKKLLENEQLKNMARNDNLFNTEAHYYEKLGPLLGPFGPDCILAQPDEIIMEDLGQQNYAIAPKRAQLDLDHCLAVVRTLATLHASSLSLKLNQPEEFARLVEPLTENVFPQTGEVTGFAKFFENSLGYAIYVLDTIKDEDPEIEKSVDFLKGFQGILAETLQKLLVPRPEDDRYRVLTHGDTWNNNIMFQHDDQGKVRNVKLVDFQIVRHSTPAIDMIYFLYSSARTEVLQNHLDELLDVYEKTFVQEMRRRKAPLRDIEARCKPGWYKEEIRRYGLLGFFGAMMVIHAIFMDDAVAAELEKNKTEEKIDYNEEVKLEDWPADPDKTDRIKFMVGHYLKKFT